MVKLKNIKAHDLKDVDPETIKEIEDLSIEISNAISPICMGHSPNIILASLGWVHAVVIKKLISDNPEELEKAAHLCAATLILDIERIKDMP